MTDIPVPLNSDGRYYWYGTAAGVVGPPMTFVGDPNYLVDTGSLTWTILQRASDGSQPKISYSIDGGTTYTDTIVGSEGTPQEPINESGQILVDLTGATGFRIVVASINGSVVANATEWILGVAITRNANETIPWDFPNPFNPISYNCSRLDLSGYLADTLGNLRRRLLIRLGFSNQAANPPPGMAALANDLLISAQTYLYRRYMALHTRRFFRWKIIPGQRFYSLKDNDEDVLSNFHMDPLRKIEWVGVQDTRNVWYPMIKGIPPQLYTMIAKPWRPARYDIKQCIEIYPAPDQVYFLWMRANFGLLSFAADGDQTTLDSELVFLSALANGKAHYGQPDANNIQAQANAYRGELIAGTHETAHYIPGTIAVPPAVRPTLIQYQDNQGG